MARASIDVYSSSECSGCPSLRRKALCGAVARNGASPSSWSSHRLASCSASSSLERRAASFSRAASCLPFTSPCRKASRGASHSKLTEPTPCSRSSWQASCWSCSSGHWLRISSLRLSSSRIRSASVVRPASPSGSGQAAPLAPAAGGAARRPSRWAAWRSDRRAVSGTSLLFASRLRDCGSSTPSRLSACRASCQPASPEGSQGPRT
mmetsp:Transcript_139723/g.434615  ORF Transcript_139723/g.434615 Transcript_139723/m.434615 type:complete len:208 (+) Transcript_139723:771-1394(+)